MDKKLTDIRHYLHMNPELSGEEVNTASYITALLEETRPDELWNGVGGNGIVAFYKGAKRGKNIAFRAELDGLPITETNDLNYKSRKQGVAHSCGHDGHMAIVFGVAEYASRMRENMAGSVAVIFQPEEETGTGAAKMLDDERMKSTRFDYVLALHNLPGFDESSIIIRKNVFTSTTTGMIIKLYGATSHAGQPEHGNSPVMAMTAIINYLNSLPQLLLPMHRSALVTIIHARLGEIAFGTTPGYAHVMATMRAHDAEDLDRMKTRAQVIAESIAGAYNLRCEIKWVEYFPAMINDEILTEEVIDTAKELELPVVHKEHPFSWSEDFSFFARRDPGVLFGLGCGIDHPQVHNENYDFPDSLLETGVKLFTNLIDKFTVER